MPPKSDQLCQSAYLSIVSYPPSECVAARKREINKAYYFILCKTSGTAHPAIKGAQQARIELGMLIFRLGTERSCQLTMRVDGIDQNFLFGMCSRPAHARGASFPSQLGVPGR